MRNSLLLIVSAIFLLSCSEQRDKRGALTKKETIPNDINEVAVQAFKTDTVYGFDLQENTSDTLILVSHSWYFYYCFGKFTSPKELKSHFKRRFEIVDEATKVYNVPANIDTLYRVKLGNGFIKFLFSTLYEDTERNEMALVSAKISEPTVQMTNGLRVGLTKDEVKKILFPNGAPTAYSIKNILLIVTALDGVWVTLSFNNNVLTKIIIDTNYQVNKE